MSAYSALQTPAAGRVQSGEGGGGGYVSATMMASTALHSMPRGHRYTPEPIWEIQREPSPSVGFTPVCVFECVRMGGIEKERGGGGGVGGGELWGGV